MQLIILKRSQYFLIKKILKYYFRADHSNIFLTHSSKVSVGHFTVQILARNFHYNQFIHKFEI